MIVRNFDLFLNAGKAIPLLINVNQFDHGEKWIFTLYNDDGTQYIPSTGAIVGVKSDGLGIVNTATVDSTGRVVANETRQMTAAPGRAEFELSIDDGKHGTANFFLQVEPKPGDNADLSESDYSMIEQAIDAAERIAIYGSPLVAQTVSQMNDPQKIYVYTGSETGYVNGNWYYNNGTAWVSGGVYNSQGINTDQTLSIANAAADAKATGDALATKITMPSSGVTDQVLAKTANGVAWVDKAGQIYMLQPTVDSAGNVTITLNRYLASEETPETAGIIRVINSVSESSSHAVQSGAVYEVTGGKSNLSTTNKTNLVAAINEVNSLAGAAKTGADMSAKITNNHDGTLAVNYATMQLVDVPTVDYFITSSEISEVLTG